jgi:hypothetical protein
MGIECPVVKEAGSDGTADEDDLPNRTAAIQTKVGCENENNMVGTTGLHSPEHCTHLDDGGVSGGSAPEAGSLVPGLVQQRVSKAKTRFEVRLTYKILSLAVFPLTCTAKLPEGWDPGRRLPELNFSPDLPDFEGLPA